MPQSHHQRQPQRQPLEDKIYADGAIEIENSAVYGGSTKILLAYLSPDGTGWWCTAYLDYKPYPTWQMAALASLEAKSQKNPDNLLRIDVLRALIRSIP